jgi:hypothetical protein
MRRALHPVWLLLLTAGCVVAPDQDRANPPAEQVPIKPRVKNGPPQGFAELAKLVFHQVEAADQAYFVNKWPEVEEAAKQIQETAELFSKAPDVPARYKDNLSVEVVRDLKSAAAMLEEAARAKNVKNADEAFQKLQLKVHQLRAVD